MPTRTVPVYRIGALAAVTIYIDTVGIYFLTARDHSLAMHMAKLY